MNRNSLRKLAMTSLLAGGLTALGGTALAVALPDVPDAPQTPSLPSADDLAATDLPFHSASTPGSTPVVEQESISTPAEATPAVTTPHAGASADVQSIALPAHATADTDGLIGQDVETPSATPAVTQSPNVDSLTVQPVEVASVSTPPITVDAIELPVTARADRTANGELTAGAAGIQVTVAITR